MVSQTKLRILLATDCKAIRYAFLYRSNLKFFICVICLNNVCRSQIDQGLPQAEQSLSSAAKTKTETASLPLRFTEPGGDTSTKVQEEKESCCRSFFTVFKSMMDFKVMLIPVFTLFAISNFLTNFGTNVPYIQLAVRQRHRNNAKNCYS